MRCFTGAGHHLGCSGRVLGPSHCGLGLLLSQTYTAVYYVLADLMMLTLYFHYKFKKRPSPCESGDHPGSGSAALGKPGI